MARTELEVCKHDLDKLEVDLKVQNGYSKRTKELYQLSYFFPHNLQDDMGLNPVNASKAPSFKSNFKLSNLTDLRVLFLKFIM